MDQLPEYRIYRANKTNTGVASSWQLSYKEQNQYDKWQFFLIMSKQIPSDNDNAKFDWKNPITVKLGENDIGEILSVLERRKDAAGYNGSLFHQTPGGGNKVIKFQKSESGFYLNVSAQDKEKKALSLNQGLSAAEASILSVLLKQAIMRIYGW